jgi:hypothetical protein
MEPNLKLIVVFIYLSSEISRLNSVCTLKLDSVFLVKTQVIVDSICEYNQSLLFDFGFIEFVKSSGRDEYEIIDHIVIDIWTFEVQVVGDVLKLNNNMGFERTYLRQKEKYDFGFSLIRDLSHHQI